MNNKIIREESSSEEKDLYNYMFHCLAVRLNSVFNYYLGIVLKYIKPEYKQDIIKYYINVYGDDSLNSMRDLHVFAQIVNILDNEDKKIIIEKYNYDAKRDKMNCKVGQCIDYKEVLKFLDKYIKKLS